MAIDRVQLIEDIFWALRNHPHAGVLRELSRVRVHIDRRDPKNPFLAFVSEEFDSVHTTFQRLGKPKKAKKT